jgi:tRNA dimethylallyltransferase
MKEKDKIYILLGPTASGKSGVITRLSENFSNLNVINCDSKQLYKEIPTITAQPKQEEIDKFNYQLYNFVSINDHYNISSWLSEASNCIKNSITNNKKPLLVGGTGFYIKALTDGLSEIPEISRDVIKFVDEKIKDFGRVEFYEYLSTLENKIVGKIEPNDIYRLTKAGQVFFQTKKSIFDFYDNKKNNEFDDCEFVIVVLLPDREELYKNIAIRFDDMIQDGVLTEVYKVFLNGLERELPSYKAHGLPELLDYFDGKIELEDAIEIAKKNTRNYAKRQFTWFRHQIPSAIIFNNTVDVEDFFIREFSC